jgi:hypothetical protein
MPIGILFWVIWVLAFILSLYWGRGDISSGNYNGIGGSLIFLVLTFLLAWKVFGFVVSG